MAEIYNLVEVFHTSKNSDSLKSPLWKTETLEKCLNLQNVYLHVLCYFILDKFVT